jgi:hypothetical protein
MLYLENYRYQNNLVIIFSFNSVEDALLGLDNLMELYLSEGILFVYEILIGELNCEIIFKLSNGH